jgi:hypothetical protein
VSNTVHTDVFGFIFLSFSLPFQAKDGLIRSKV